MDLLGKSVTFQTDFFKPDPTETEETNPNCYGKELALYLAEKLKERGVETQKILPEDWGWIVMAFRKPFMLWLGCSNIDESVDKWNIFIVAEIPIWRRFFKRIDPTQQINELRLYLEEIVAQIPNISNKRWDLP
ncbi:MAG: hypothetical protein LBQ52_06300 [Helicobacteraceae bacterium]|jgi:hypothetical protein|nr:hypothetical protein [Helicobacteraceae bacterium]